MTLLGPGGSGKTRLVGEFLAWARVQSADTLLGRAFAAILDAVMEDFGLDKLSAIGECGLREGLVMDHLARTARAAATASGHPTASPAETGNRASRSTIHRTPLRRAPSAIRTPISRARRAVP